MVNVSGSVDHWTLMPKEFASFRGLRLLLSRCDLLLERMEDDVAIVETATGPCAKERVERNNRSFSSFTSHVG